MEDIVEIVYEWNEGKVYSKLSKENQEIFANRLLSLFFDKNGNLLTVDRSSKKFSKITFFNTLLWICFGKYKFLWP